MIITRDITTTYYSVQVSLISNKPIRRQCQKVIHFDMLHGVLCKLLKVFPMFRICHESWFTYYDD